MPNYITPTISKVFERLILGQIKNNFNPNNLSCDQQHGFRSGQSSEWLPLN